MGALEPRFFSAFCDAIGRPELIALQYDPSAAGTLEDIFRSKTQAEWVSALAGVDACVEPVVAARPAGAVEAPKLGADRDAILLELGIEP